MSERLQIEEYVDFKAAAARARRLAVDFKECVGVRRTRDGWAVLASDALSKALDCSLVEDDDSAAWESDLEYEESDPAEEDYEHEVMRPIREEIEMDRDNWARSEEDGWFYGDDD